MNPTLRTRIFLSYIVLIGLSTLVITLIAGRQIQETTENGFYEGFDESVEIAVATIEDLRGEQIETDAINDDELIEEILDLSTTLDLHLMLLDIEDDFVIFDSESKRRQYVLDGEFEDVEILWRLDDPINVEFDELGRVYRAHFVYHLEEPVMILRGGASWEEIERDIRNQVLILLGGTLIAGIFLTVILGSWLANALTKPLIQLRTTAQQMADGKLNTRANTQAPPEISLLAQDFNQMAEAVEAMVAEQKTFASNAAHELRTPLTAIRLRTETLLEDDPDDDLQLRYIREIDAEAIRLSQLVKDLRLLSRADAERLVAGDETVDVGRILHQVYRQLEFQIQEKNLTYHANLPSQPTTMQASGSHLQIVLRNIIENAVKYTPENGVISVSLESKNQELHLEVKDNGIGISAEDLPHLFHRFYRVDKARNRAIPGSGLGLSLVKEIVGLYAGIIQLTSDGINQGTTVRLMFPNERILA